MKIVIIACGIVFLATLLIGIYSLQIFAKDEFMRDCLKKSNASLCEYQYELKNK